jgi:23S rRNA pseudouridine1911/1915/1917 synthase
MRRREDGARRGGRGRTGAAPADAGVARSEHDGNGAPAPPPTPGTDWRVEPAEAGRRLDKFLAAPQRLASRGRAAAALDRGQVWVNGEERGGADGGLRLAAGDLVRLWRDRPGSARRRTRPRALAGFRVVFEDAALIVVDKPAGLLTVPLPDPGAQPSVLDGLDAEYAARTRRAPLVVHRIDRDTSGLVVFAKTRPAWSALRRQFARREPERVYLVVVHGVPAPPSGTWRDWVVWHQRALALRPATRTTPGAVEAVLRYTVRESFGRAALLEVRLVTGRQNQIRAQAMLHGHPLVGEQKYDVESAATAAEVVTCPRQALHAHRLGFAHPVTGAPVAFASPLPRDLRALLARLRRGAEQPGA